MLDMEETKLTQSYIQVVLQTLHLNESDCYILLFFVVLWILIILSLRVTALKTEVREMKIILNRTPSDKTLTLTSKSTQPKITRHKHEHKPVKVAIKSAVRQTKTHEDRKLDTMPKTETVTRLSKITEAAIKTRNRYDPLLGNAELRLQNKQKLIPKRNTVASMGSKKYVHSQEMVKNVFKKVLQMKHCYLLNELDARDIHDILFRRNVLSRDELQDIDQQSNLKVRTRKLLFTLTRKGPNGYTEFMEALIEIERQWIFDELQREEKEQAAVQKRKRQSSDGNVKFEDTQSQLSKGNEREIYRKVVQLQRTFLLDNLDVTEICDHLFSKMILYQNDFHSIESHETPQKRCRALLNILPERDPKAYEELICYLEKAENDWILNELMSTKQELENENLLSELKNIKLLGLYNSWISMKSTDLLLTRLLSVAAFKNAAKQCTGTQENKARLLFEKFLMKSTFDDINEIRQILERSEDKIHLELAKELPDRTKLASFIRPSKNEETPFAEKVVVKKTGASAPSSLNRLDSVTVRGMGKRNSRSRIPVPICASTKSVKIPKSFIKPASTIQNIYGFKRTSKPPYGMGLCLIIWNLSQDPYSYNKDVTALEHFFGEVLKYIVIGPSNFNLKNLTKTIFDEVLNQVVKLLAKHHFDRFFLFILSPSNEKGIQMNVMRNRVRTDMYYKVKDIIAKFTHDKLSEMKDFPKCFFIDAYRRPTMKHSLSFESPRSIVSRDQDPSLISIERDILVCYPPKERTFPMKESQCSLFINICLDVFETHYRTEHLLDMLVEVTRRVSDAQITRKNGNRNKQEINDGKAPQYVCALCKKFYLYVAPR